MRVCHLIAPLLILLLAAPAVYAIGRDPFDGKWDVTITPEGGGKEIKDPRKWVGSQLRGLRMQGMVDFPTITGATKR